ncbi:MAG TPA: alpha/beta fold hydrolase [Candidatus Acidoferrum sp.]|nr:alpha/beta fold hydrolase [Candidatus Acidoferrum sp.]
MLARLLILTWVAFVPSFAPAALAQSLPQTPEAHAREVLNQMATGKFAAVEAQYDEHVKAALPAGKLAATWSALTGQVGNLVEVTGAYSQQASGNEVVTLACAFERMKLDVIVGFNANGEIAGLRFIPHQDAPDWSPPGYAVPSAFTEQPVTVQFQHWALPGTLTIPNGSGPFPIAVLVQGSGPHDADETIGPNKPFKDLAWGLASQGVAVLRYTKRTAQYGLKASDDPAALTVDDETVNDARAAVALAATQARIDPKRVYVLGHSLGGYLAPRIAQGDPQVAGVVLLAGSCRPLEQIVVEQIRYIVGISNMPADEAQRRIAKAEQDAKAIESPDLKKGDTVHLAGAPVPASYFLDLRNYHPAEMAASLSIPILVLRGTRDYNVTSADYDAWRQALSARPNVSFKLYPGLTHLFMPSISPGDGLGTPADDDHPGHVDADVVRDISAWVLSGGQRPKMTPAKGDS